MPASRTQALPVALTVTAPQTGGEYLAWQAQARWRAPDGQEVTHEIAVPSGTVAGQKFRIWTDRTGDFATAPLLDSQVAGQTAFEKALGVLASAGVLTLAGALAIRTLNKRRMVPQGRRRDGHLGGHR